MARTASQIAEAAGLLQNEASGKGICRQADGPMGKFYLCGLNAPLSILVGNASRRHGLPKVSNWCALTRVAQTGQTVDAAWRLGSIIA